MAARHEQRAAATQRLALHLLTHGLSQTGVRQLAASAGISDRMLLYYFESREDALQAALQQVADGLEAQLAAATGERMPPEALLPVLKQFMLAPEAWPAAQLWLELVALSARGRAPFDAIAKRIGARFLQWAEDQLDLPEGPERTAAAREVLGAVEGEVVLAAVGLRAGP